MAAQKLNKGQGQGKAIGGAAQGQGAGQTGGGAPKGPQPQRHEDQGKRGHPAVGFRIDQEGLDDP